MRTLLTSGEMQIIAILSCAVTAGCSGGGGGSATLSSASQTPTTTTTSPTPNACVGCVDPVHFGSNYDTGIAAGPIAAPAAASFGSAPVQTATSASPTFDKSNGVNPTNVTFPLISTNLKATSPGIISAPSPDATILVNSATPANFQLVIPSIGVNANFTSIENLAANSSGWTWGYSYVAVGSWATRSGGSGPLQSNSFYSFGFETPTSGIPTTGSAQFAGIASGNVFIPNNGTILSTEVDGKASVAVNFSSGQINGSLTQMVQLNGQSAGGTLPWNDVSLTANLTSGSNRFSGTATAANAPATAFGLSNSATGHFDGALYGPTAQNIGAVWSLSDGSKSAIGALAGKQ
jgi:hypothetical protein